MMVKSNILACINKWLKDWMEWKNTNCNQFQNSFYVCFQLKINPQQTRNLSKHFRGECIIYKVNKSNGEQTKYFKRHLTTFCIYFLSTSSYYSYTFLQCAPLVLLVQLETDIFSQFLFKGIFDLDFLVKVKYNKLISYENQLI